MRKIIALLLICALLLTSFSACGFLGLDLAPNLPQQEETDSEEGATPRDAYIPRDGRLSIAYWPTDSLNPYTTSTRDNLAASGLLYESLFVLEEDFTASNELAVGLTTLDGRNYTIEILQDVTFHNGAPFTVRDVVYSLNRARNSDLFGGRLSIISDHRFVENPDGTVNPYLLEFTLSRVHGNVQVLLTFPIIQEGSSAWRVPPGTGPFRYPDDGTHRFVYHAAHRYEQQLPVRTIYLEDIQTMEQMTAYFNSGLLDIAYLDLHGPDPQFAATREQRQLNTSTLDFIGFNIHRPHTGRLEVRQAIQFAIDREYITNNILRGHAIATPLPMHPALHFYNTELSLAHRFDLAHARDLLHGLPEEMDDTYPTEPELPYVLGDYDDEEDEDLPPEPEPPNPQLRLIVAQGSVARIEAAVYVAANISALGFQVVVEDLPPNAFLAALESGNFDLFYGQVRLQPDFDLRELIGGTLAFGGMDLLVNPLFVENFIASGQSGRADAAAQLNSAILHAVPFVSIGFRYEYLFTQRGVVSNLNPSQERVYRDVFSWILDL